MKIAQNYHHFALRHIGISEEEKQQMLETINVSSLNELIDQTIPASIRNPKKLNLPDALTEFEYLNEIERISEKNQVFKSYIGLGYYGTITPSVIKRNILENPGWYTQYTPYQAEIAQGRLEALLNFQTVVSDLTGMEIANASLLDEATAAAEAMIMLYNTRNKPKKVEAPIFLVAESCFPATIEVLKTRAVSLGIEVKVQEVNDFNLNEQVFGILLQYPCENGLVEDYKYLTEKAKDLKIQVAVAADLMSLTLLTPPAEWGADVVIGTTQRFGVPMGYGGPHAAYFATKESYKRRLPGRIIGVSVDRRGKAALRMALQTREQHIRRDKATSNICTAQALLAIMAGMYAVYHGAERLKAIATNIHLLAQDLEKKLEKLGFNQKNTHYFDTLSVEVNKNVREKIKEVAEAFEVNFRYKNNTEITISLDETTSYTHIERIYQIFALATNQKYFETQPNGIFKSPTLKIPNFLQRTSTFLTHPVFSAHQTETKMMRYIKKLENKDLSLTHSMIALGSCTMKLNAATQLMPVSWAKFGNIHPFAPIEQTEGYQQIFEELSEYLSEITGFAACSLQPNSGAQGEYSGLMSIRAYHHHNKDFNRKIVLIPSSAHGTNPASAVMAGMKVVVVRCDENGNVDIVDLREKATKYSENLSALMITYPSTHGVFEESVKEVCEIVHQNGGLVYMDGANMNAQVGLTSPGMIGADVCHLNLHKTFAIPHGGGGPGMGPICVNEKLKPFLPSHDFLKENNLNKSSESAVSQAPWGSASILLVSYAYIRLLGEKGLTDSTKFAILNANYIKERLKEKYEVLYLGKNERVAHELILDMRRYKHTCDIDVGDIAKRLMDYGFHAPTVSFPVPGTIMIEPTESESLEEIDRFCEAMLAIKREIDEIRESGEFENNVLKNAPHTQEEVTANEWNYPYSREKAAFPLDFVRENKFWASVSRINDSYGDRNLICTCPSVEEYGEEVEI